MAHDPHDEIPGWHVEPGQNGTWLARRRGTLSALQVEYGCRALVGANSRAELELACTTEDVKAGLVRAAERLAEGMAEAEIKRQEDARRAQLEPGSGINL
ncbi:hypothetical protein [Actinomadura rugatobispora]|uniref:DUF1876 domain-containing protein n=1 Tax=Actinomadura rugatobispora TaxID=1994 RepID=A0ABW1AFR0_9ACTN|nr:hypothetical protein GCM10010200_072350 [Actinomadura rugatobispora]